MKPIYASILSSLVCILFLQVPFFAKADTSESNNIPVRHGNCESAVSMNCQTQGYLKSDFLNAGLNVMLNQESCIVPVGQEIISEYWLSVSLSGNNTYYLEGIGVDVGIEIYTGSCGNLEMVDCVNAFDDDTFIGFYPPVSAHYYIRLLGYNSSARAEFEVVLNCGVPEPACAVSINNIDVGACISNSGTIGVFMSGIVAPEPDMPVIFAEVKTDAGLYVFTGESVNGQWEASFEVSGTVINYVSVFCGNSGNGCGDVRAGSALPSIPCDSLYVPNFTGLLDWHVNCGSRGGEVKLYELNTNNLLETYSVTVLSTGLFGIENAPVGIYDMILKVDGFLPKGFSSVPVSLTDISYGCGILNQGDVNNDGVINIIDLTTLLIWFNGVLPSDNSLDYLDQNCDGVIDILDLNSIIDSFGQIGDSVPLH